MSGKNQDSNLPILGRSLSGVAKNVRRRPNDLRYHGLRELWSTVKRAGSHHVENVEMRELPGVEDALIEGYFDDPNRALLAALCQAGSAKSFFEIGTNRGRTAYTVARSNPELRVVTLDLPSPDAGTALDTNASDRDFFGEEWASGSAFHDTPEAERIEAVFGDSATFDFSPWKGTMDGVLIDGAHSYSYVKNDTERALEMLSPTGFIAWDDYPAIPGVYRYLEELAPTLDRPLYHVLGTRLVLYARRDLVRRVSDYGHLGAA